MLDAEADRICGAERYPGLADRVDTPGGKTPGEGAAECSSITLLTEQVAASYASCCERIRHPDYRTDQKFAAFHTSGYLRSS